VRIRQIRPEFFTDPVTGRLPAPVQVAYIGLWCVADDAGWLDWDVPQIGALLYPYKSVHAREALIVKAGASLVAVGRLSVLDCGCARIPTLAAHQKIGGNKSFTGREKHERHEVQTRMDLYARNVTLGNGRVGNGTREAAQAPHGAASLRETLLAAGMKPEIAGKAS
jgi:hypothetical protein